MPEPANHVGVVPLRDAADVHDYGGKASCLARLASLGLPVPDGFCISSGAATHLTRTTLEQIQDHLQRLSTKHVAVRSSASLEDSLISSLAGIFRSELEVPATVSDVVDAISKVVGSLSSETLLPYLHRLGIHNELKMAVLVQIMLKPEVAGVLFTCDPITKRSDFVIEALRNKAGSVQAGRGIPTRLVVERKGSIGLASSPQYEPAASSAVLDPRTVTTLINLALKCEDILGSGQDIEWAVQRSSVWILQSRPITGLMEESDG